MAWQLLLFLQGHLFFEENYVFETYEEWKLIPRINDLYPKFQLGKSEKVPSNTVRLFHMDELYYAKLLARINTSLPLPITTTVSFVCLWLAVDRQL
jgi:hypothetical protein